MYPVHPYRRIGSGYYYNVFDLGNGRVRKLEKSFLERFIHIAAFEKTPRNIFAQLRLTGRKAELRKEYEQLLAAVDPALLGHPRLLAGLAYEQDWATVLEEIVKYSPEAKVRHVIDQYVELVLLSWEYGFSDRVYNFTINNGLTKEGRIVLLDFNEITFLKEDVRNSIVARRWSRSWSCRSLPPSYRTYYERRMDEAVTEESLDRQWGLRLASNPRS